MKAASLRAVYRAPRTGFVARVEPRAIGRGITAMGGGRTKMEDLVDPGVGFVISARPGAWVKEGAPLAEVLGRTPADIETGLAVLRDAIALSDEPPAPLPLVSHRVTDAGVEALA